MAWGEIGGWASRVWSMRFEEGVMGAEKITKMVDMCGAICFSIQRSLP
ncbi:hypothetical protein [Bartonella queenslandensis]|nr:hypothetical protein [Bartonella queenslandensis]